MPSNKSNATTNNAVSYTHLTMKMIRPADEYIRLVDSIAERTLWNDANYQEYRQKTTEKSKYYRKILKIYDKTVSYTHL